MSTLKANHMRSLCLYLTVLATSVYLSSCMKKTVVLNSKHDNGLHKGWYKNPNNPHNPTHQASHNSNTKTVAPASHGNSGKVSPGNSGHGQPGNSGHGQPGNSGHGQPGNSGKAKKK